MIDPRPNPPTPRDPLPGLPYPNIFTAMPYMPERVFIVGTGPNGLEYIPQIPEDAYTIALNAAVCQWRPWTWWMAFDHRVVDADFWAEVRPTPATKRLFSSRLANRIWTDETIFPRIQPDFYFRYYPHITGGCFLKEVNPLIHGMLRGLTVAGCALQFALYGGAKDIILCGVDMFGPNHIDGQVNVGDEYQGVWPWALNLSRLCKHIKHLGRSVTSLSKTALEIERTYL